MRASKYGGEETVLGGHLQRWEHAQSSAVGRGREADEYKSRYDCRSGRGTQLKVLWVKAAPFRWPLFSLGIMMRSAAGRDYRQTQKAAECKFIGASICLIPPIAWCDIFLGIGAEEWADHPGRSSAVWTQLRTRMLASGGRKRQGVRLS